MRSEQARGPWPESSACQQWTADSNDFDYRFEPYELCQRVPGINNLNDPFLHGMYFTEGEGAFLVENFTISINEYLRGFV